MLKEHKWHHRSSFRFEIRFFSSSDESGWFNDVFMINLNSLTQVSAKPPRNVCQSIFHAQLFTFLYFTLILANCFVMNLEAWLTAQMRLKTKSTYLIKLAPQFNPIFSTDVCLWLRLFCYANKFKHNELFLLKIKCFKSRVLVKRGSSFSTIETQMNKWNETWGEERNFETST